MRRFLVCLAALPVVLAVTAAPASISASATPSTAAPLAVPVEHAATLGPPKGLMISMATWRYRPASELAGWLAYVCAQHAPGSQPGAINELVVMDVAAADTSTGLRSALPELAQDKLDRDRLAVVLPYFPGGTAACQFDRVYVGTVDFSQMILATPGLTHPYHDEVLDPAVVRSMVTRSAAVAASFRDFVDASGHQVSWDWYLTQEALLDYFTDSNATTAGAFAGGRTALLDGAEVAAATRQLLVRTSQALQAVRPAARILWSPGFAQPPGAFFGPGGADRTRWRATLRAFFADYRDALLGTSAGRGPLVLALQDHVGSSGWSSGTACPQTMTPADALTWYRELAGVFTGADLVMNVEQFRRATPGLCQQGGFAPGYGAVLTARERYYAARGVRLGPSFDLQAWSASNRSNWGLYRRTEFVGPQLVDSQRRTLSAVLRTSDGKPLVGAPVSLLECDPTGGSCQQVSPSGALATPRSGSGGRVRIEVPLRSGSSFWRLAVPDTILGLTASGSVGWLASESALVRRPAVVRVAASWRVRSSARAARRITVRAQLSTTDGKPLAGVRVRLVRCAPRTACRSSRVLRTVRTDARGWARGNVRRPSGRSVRVQWRSVRTTRVLAARSVVLNVPRRR